MRIITHLTGVRLVRAAVFVACGLLIAGAGAEQTTQPKQIFGEYTFVLRGFLRGTGRATVHSNAVLITAHVRDDSGNTYSLRALPLPLKGYRFAGNGTAGGLPIRLRGRIDPPGEILRTARLSCLVDDAQGRHGRIVGAKSD